jgi:hypothetical protein
MQQSDLFGATAFNARLAEALKEEGIARSQAAHDNLLDLGRQYVKQAALGRDDRTATADDAARGFEAAGLSADSLGNASGALFRGKDWYFTGRWQKSSRATNHSHQNRVWRYVGPQ